VNGGGAVLGMPGVDRPPRGMDLHLPVIVILVVSISETYYMLFRVPLWCGAQTREGLWCRNNSRMVASIRGAIPERRRVVISI
jgi:hypothetical protein